jgi:SAM-dependent methyltransferase
VRKVVFDVVVSSLVLCTIEDDDEVATILRELREVCAPGGRIVVAICNPGSVARSTLLQSREPCRTPDVRTRTFKTLRPTGVRRADVHRPLRVMLDLFAHAGLRVRRREETISFDPDTLEPSSDFLIVELEPAGRRRP